MSGGSPSAWDKVDILLKPIGGLLTALAVAWLGLQGRAILEDRQSQQTRSQLYAQLMSSREQSDSSLRQSMFKTIIDGFLVDSADVPERPPGGPALLAHFDREVLKLEVLAYNFHEALDLAPLFKHVHRQLTELRFSDEPGVDEDAVEDLLERLEKVATEVTDKQLAALEESGAVRRVRIDFEDFQKEQILEKVVYGVLRSNEETASSATSLQGKKFMLDVVDLDPERKEVEVRLTIWTLDSEKLVDVTFHVGFFDFPMIDNTRLGDGERCAVVLHEFNEFNAGIVLVYFPGSRASLKEKPFYDEIVQELIADQQTADAPR